MKRINLKRVVSIFIIMGFILGGSSTAFAEISNVLPDWRSGSRDSSLQEKINLLGDTVVTDVPIPILFGITTSSLTGNFGVPRVGGRTHEGLDIMAPLGTPIVSPTKSVVTSMGNQELAGLYVYTRNPGGETFGYMHLDSFAPNLARGTVLEAGDLIGFVGKTGNAQWGDPHLHFEIRKDVAMDPYPRLTREFSLQEKINFTTKILDKVSNKENLATFLVSQYKSTFQLAQNQNIALPEIINTAMSNITIANKVITTGLINYSFDRNLQINMSGDDVQKLQRFLNSVGFIVATTGVGSPGYETKTFGPLTRAAVIKYQIANNIYPTVGFFGPLTRAHANNKINVLQIKL